MDVAMPNATAASLKQVGNRLGMTRKHLRGGASPLIDGT